MSIKKSAVFRTPAGAPPDRTFTDEKRPSPSLFYRQTRGGDRGSWTDARRIAACEGENFIV